MSPEEIKEYDQIAASLLPCPFCGNKPSHGTWGGQTIKCYKCKIEFGEVGRRGNEYFKTLADKWNRRRG